MLLIHSRTDQNAGHKACRAVLRAFKIDEKLTKKIMDLLNDKSMCIYSVFKPHMEITNLLDRCRLD